MSESASGFEDSIKRLKDLEARQEKELAAAKADADERVRKALEKAKKFVESSSSKAVADKEKSLESFKKSLEREERDVLREAEAEAKAISGKKIARKTASQIVAAVLGA